MRFDLAQSLAFIAAWDAHRANRAEVARQYGLERSYAYDVAERCREKIDAATPEQIEKARTPLVETRG